MFKFWSKRKVVTDSQLLSTVMLRDQSSDNPYYTMANTLAWAIDEDPSAFETLKQFVERHVSAVQLDAEEMNKVGWNVAYCKNVFENDLENQDFYISREKVRKLKLQKAVEKNRARDVALRLKAEQRELIEAQLSSGLPISPDWSILTVEEAEATVLKFKQAKMSDERRKVWQLLEAGEPIDFEPVFISEHELSLLRENYSITQLEGERERIREALERGEESQRLHSELLSDLEIAQLVEEFNSVRNSWLRTRHRPKQQPYGVSFAGAEGLVSDWLRYLGLTNVTVTQASQDGGVDVLSDLYACQVKHYSVQAVSVQEMRELFGVATILGKQGLFFTSTSLSSAAYDFAERAGIPAIKFNVEVAELSALNELGAKILLDGSYE